MSDTFTVYNGTNGYSILSGTNDPIGSNGSDNDLYLNLTSYELFKKESGTWITKGIIKGSDGLDGTNGTNGTNGNDGTNGTNGKTPEFQINGINLEWRYVGDITWISLGQIVGADGAAGANGSDGATGAKGDQGIQGDQGIPGPKGDTGTTGATGADGADGDIYKTTSATSVDLSTKSIGDSIVLTVSASNLAYSNGQILVGVNNSVSTESIIGTVTAYTGTTLTLRLDNKSTNNTITSWTINLAGLTGYSSVNEYTITATAGTGTVGSRTYTAPSGWTVGSSDTITVTGLGNNSTDLTLQHNLNRSVYDVIVYANLSGKNSKLIGAVSYTGLDEDTANVAIELLAFATILEALTIKIRFSE